MASYLLGIDYGTGGAKACVIDEDGVILSYDYSEYPIIVNHPGWSEHDAENYWDIACKLIKKCLSIAKLDPRKIKAAAVSSALPCMVMIDGDGNPVNNAYNLMDRRAEKEVVEVREKIGEREVFAISGNRLEDHPSIVNLLWEKRNRPEDFARIRKVLTIEGFINFKLTGAYTLVHQNAVFHGPVYNIREKKYEDGVFGKLGIEKALYPELRFCEEIIGSVSESASLECGLAPGTMVAAGQADFNASCIASGVIAEGDVQMNLGTCGNFGIIHGDTNFIFEMIALGFTVDSKNNYITIPTTTTGGMSLRYLRDAFGQAEQTAAGDLGLDVYDLLNLQAERIKPGSEGLVVLPYLMGERTPIWDTCARGCIFGLSLNHGKGHLIRATMEGVAYALYDSFQVIKKAGRKVNEPIVLHEGGAKSGLWRSIVTDVFGVSTVVTEERTGAPYGDAILAGVASGVFDDYSVGKRHVKYIGLMEPNSENHKMYGDYFSLYKSLYAHLKEDYRTLAALRGNS